ncbi:Helix-turn-helix domain protein [compost metagenome]|uniref:TniQ family protein n=1 Tax=unclassified Pseudomonas TaxID=196821 RepID=UPI000FC37D0F|nr:MULTISPECIES: TniQ family protein [unclassified Pseudomonas]
MFGLTVDLSVVPGESLTNFLQRVAAANFLKLTDLVAHLRDSTQPNIFPDSLLPTTWRSAYEHLTSQTTNKTWSCLKPKICTFCFSEHQQIKEPWDLTLNTVCASHNILLRDRCHHCASPFNLKTIECQKCLRCGASILNCTTTHHFASQEAVWLCCEFEKRLMGIRSDGCSSVDQLDTLDFHCIAMCLADLGCSAENAYAKKSNNLHQIENVYRMTSMAGRLLSDWPASFHCSLQKLNARVATSKRNSAARYADRLRMNIYERLASPAFDFVRSELEKHSPHSDCTPGNLQHHDSYLPSEPRKLTSLKAISTAININAPLLKRLIAEGELHGYRGISACGNRTIVADLKQAEHLAATLPPLLNVAKAANQLKLPINTIKVLCKDGFFTCLGGRPAAGQSWWIDVSSFDTSNACLKRQRSSASTLLLRNVLQHPFMSEEGVAHLFQAIQEGALSVSITGKSDVGVIGEWRLGNDEWHAWLSAHMKQMANSQSLSVSQAAKDLNITKDVAYALIRYGLLNSTVELRNGVKSRRINLNAIENFKQSYILGKELAKTLCLTSKKAATHMKKLGMVPVASPSSSLLKCRQYVWPKDACFGSIERSA